MKTPEERAKLLVGKWDTRSFVSMGYDMRSDKERASDEAWERERQEKINQARKAEEEKAQVRAEEERIAREQKDWFEAARKRDEEMQKALEARSRLEEMIRRSKEEATDPEWRKQNPRSDAFDPPEAQDTEPGVHGTTGCGANRPNSRNRRGIHAGGNSSGRSTRETGRRRRVCEAG